MSASSGEDITRKPEFSTDDAELISRKQFGISGVATELPSERDQNFKLVAGAESFVLKIANPETPIGILELENQAIRLAEAIPDFNSAMVVKSKDGPSIVELAGSDEHYHVRCLGFVPGVPFASISKPEPQLLRIVGSAIAHLDNALAALNQNVAAKRELRWDLKHGFEIVQETLPKVNDPERRQILECCLARFRSIQDRFDSLPKSVIHNDPNDYNLIVDQQGGEYRIGLIDFGDIVYSQTVNNLAICLAYISLERTDPIECAMEVIRGYTQIRSIEEIEFSVLFELMCMRLAQSVSIAHEQTILRPEDKYLSVTETPAWNTLSQLTQIEPARARLRFSDVCWNTQLEFDSSLDNGDLDASQILEIRQRHISPSLSLAYNKPLHIVRGKGQYLFDAEDRTYLDCVNNVCHVGHCNPRVVNAATSQLSQLNTNTRYLNQNIVRYAEKLLATLPSTLEVLYLVNSGSEANDLALRLARNFTEKKGVVVVEDAYHGHLTSLIEISPYKFASKGGAGRPSHVHVVPAPDGFRGEFKYADPERGSKYAQKANLVIQSAHENGNEIGCFFAESMLSCGGQIPLPPGYLNEVYKCVRGIGAVCIADEVQVGFGRVGTHFWGFQQQDVVPEIVTMGKPIGNGHPLAAVVTTREIADAFDNGMEYFNTFGGNPVSCAIGLAVLEEIEQQELQHHARSLGEWLVDQFWQLADRHSIIGDVRGSGLFLGIEFVEDRATLEPATEFAKACVNRMKEKFILLSTDGPYENVIKFKPPMVFHQADAERLVSVLDKVISELTSNDGDLG